MRTLLALLILPSVAAASTQWLCSEEASQRRGDKILACGVGTGRDENAARLAAFNNAKTEFTNVCNASSDCKEHLVTAEPSRTACDEEGAGFKCTRLVTFTIGAAIDVKRTKAKHAAPAPEVVVADQPDSPFKPFVYSSLANNPKVSKGMSKADLMQAFGAPQSVSNNDNYQQMIYFGDMCEFGHCYVIIQKGRITEWNGFKPIYTTDLE